ncbi:MAG: DUF1844 domain-containing protein [Rubripirellula sp.]
MSEDDKPQDDQTGDDQFSADEAVAEAMAAADQGAAAMEQMPPASFEMLVSMLFTQGMATLGQVPDPSMEKPPVNKAYAKHYIDTLEMLGEKTKGNLSPEESKMLSEALHALRMAYVTVKAS